jgi:hypothetical protein
LADIARGDAEAKMSERPPFLFAAVATYAPVLFFELSDALDDAIFCNGTGRGSARTIPLADRDRLIELVSKALDDGKEASLTDADFAMLGCRVPRRGLGHPPAWLRGGIIAKVLDLGPISIPELDFAKALVANARKLASLSGERIRQKLAE